MFDSKHILFEAFLVKNPPIGFDLVTLCLTKKASELRLFSFFFKKKRKNSYQNVEAKNIEFKFKYEWKQLYYEHTFLFS